MDGLALAARFSLPPNLLGLCGPKKAADTAPAALKATLKKFRAPYAYLSLIAEANGLEPFDYEVVEAFWIGNKKLQGIDADDAEKVIRKRFVGTGRLPAHRAEALIANLPKKVYPHHSFHVFYIGSISGVLPRTSRALDSCRVAWGRVKKTDRTGAHVKYAPIMMDKTSVRFARQKSAIWSIDAGAGRIDAGDTVASHWKTAAMALSGRQKKNLEKYTQINMALFGKRATEDG